MIQRETKRVLLIAPEYFGYEREISDELVRQGMHVDILPDRPFSTPLMKAVTRFRPELGGYFFSDRFFSKHISALDRADYSIILVIQGEGVTCETLRRLRGAFPMAQLIFYSWDSIENKPFSRRNLHAYDRCSTFDPVDAERFGMSFRPLFFSPKFDKIVHSQPLYDLSFIGTVHSDRYRVIKRITTQLPVSVRSFVYLYLQAPWVYDVRRVFTRTIIGAKRSEFRTVPLRRNDVLDVFFASRVILDIEHPGQRGATMRTIESIGSRRKMITTNQSLREYDFFDANNIAVIDRKNPTIDADFFMTPYREVRQSVRDRYTLHRWVKDVCGI